MRRLWSFHVYDEKYANGIYSDQSVRMIKKIKASEMASSH